MKFDEYFLTESPLPSGMKVEGTLSETISRAIRNSGGSISDDGAALIANSLDLFGQWVEYSFPELFARAPRKESPRHRVIEFCDKWNIGFSGQDYEQLYNKLDEFYKMLPKIIQKLQAESEGEGKAFLPGETVASKAVEWPKAGEEPVEDEILGQVFSILTGGKDRPNQIYTSRESTKLITDNLEQFGIYLVVYFPEHFRVKKDDNIKTGPIQSRVEEFLKAWGIQMVKSGSPITFFKAVPSIFRKLRVFAEEKPAAFPTVPMRGATITQEVQNIFKSVGISLSDDRGEKINSNDLVKVLTDVFPEFIQAVGHQGRPQKPKESPQEQVAAVNQFLREVGGTAGDETASAGDLYENKLNIYKSIPTLAKLLRNFYMESRTHGDR